MVIQTQPNELNGIFGDLLNTVIGSNNNQDSTSEAEALSNALYLKQEELAAVKTKQKTTMLVAGLLAITTAYLGYKTYKKQ